ncbi:MAG: YcnI family protein [Thermoleophilaceae bacterium]
MRQRIVIAAAAVAALAVPATAGAHVTLQPDEVPAGGFARMDVRVPNERDNDGTTKVDVQFPPGFVFVSYEPVPGWDVKVTKRKLDEPIEEHGEKITEEVGRITWTGDGKTGIVRPGQFQDFGLSVGVPDDPGATLTFKALQTYESGEVVRWIGPADADEPAAPVSLTAAEEEHGSAGAAGQPASDVRAAGTVTDEDGAPLWLAVVALAIGGLGLLAGIGGLMAGRRRTA